ncbi:MAG: O-antigen ligase family protein [Bacteroidota bacterium]
MPGSASLAVDRPDRRNLLDRAAGLSFLLLAAALPWSIAPISIALVLCAALTLVRWWAPGGIRWERTPIDLPLLGWLAALAVASAFSLDPSESFPRVAKGIVFAAVALGAYHARDPREAKRVLLVLLVSAAAATVYALVRFEREGGAFPVRVRGLVGHPVTYGGQVTLLAAIGMALVAYGPSRVWRLGAGAFLALLAPAMIGSATRSAWIATLVAACVILARTRARLLPLIAVVAAAAIALAPAHLRERALSSFDTKSIWNRERIYMWEAGARIFRDHPVTGVGLQDLSGIYRRYRSPLAAEEHGHLHNIVVQVAASMGVVGLAALAWLLAGFARTAGHRWRAPLPRSSLASALRLAAVAALVAILVAGLFEWNLGDEEIAVFLCVVVGMGYAASRWEPPVETAA